MGLGERARARVWMIGRVRDRQLVCSDGERGGVMCVCGVDKSGVNVIVQSLNAPAAEGMRESSPQK